MANGPWEKYQTTQPQQQGPWTKFQSVESPAVEVPETAPLTSVLGVEIDVPTRQALTGQDEEQKRLAMARIAGIAKAREDNAQGAVGKTGARSFASGVFGLGDPVAAAFSAATTDLGYWEALEGERAYRRELQRLNPKSALAGEIGGGVAGGLGIGSQLGKLGVNLGAKGVVGLSAAEGAAIESGKEGLQAAPGGALRGALGGIFGIGTVKSFDIAGKAILNSRAGKSVAALAKKIGDTPEALARRYAEFQEMFGRPPSIAEISPQTAANVAENLSAQPGAGAVARELAGEVSQDIRGRATDVVRTGGRGTGTVVSLKRRQKQAMDEAMADVGDDIVEIPRSFITGDGAGDPITGVLKTRQFKRKINEALDAAEAGHPKDPDYIEGIAKTKKNIEDALDTSDDFVRLSVRDIENLRLALKGREGPGEAYAFTELRRELGDIAAPQSPRYRAALDEWGAREEGVKQFDAGRNLSSATAEDVAAQAQPVGTFAEAGKNLGARTQLTADIGGNTPTKFINALKSPEFQKKLGTVFSEDEVAQLASVGKQLERAGAGIEAGAPGMAAVKDQTADIVKEGAAGAFAAGTGRGGPVYAAHTAGTLEKMLRRFRPSFSEEALTKLATDLYDPDKTIKVIEILQRNGIKNQEIIDLLAASSTGVGVMTGLSSE